MYDNKLNDRVLRIMTWGPALFLIFGYWMISNNQLLTNDIYYITQTNDVEETGHIWNEVFTKEGYV